MGVEIERKYLVHGTGWRVDKGTRITQGYLMREESHSVRVRIADDMAWLGIKGRAQGGVKAEFEYAIPLDDARELMPLCPDPPIEKIRHRVAHGGHEWEVDEFLGANKGLVVAEIELETLDQTVPLPDWVGEEVTDDPRYLNANLVAHPYAMWEST
jgi:adenylate cyclase